MSTTLPPRVSRDDFTGITERRDIYHAVFMAPIDGDGGCGFLCGRNGVTEIYIVARKGPMDWIPYVEIWKGDHLHAEAAQHQVAWIEFCEDPRPKPVEEAAPFRTFDKFLCPDEGLATHDFLTCIHCGPI